MALLDLRTGTLVPGTSDDDALLEPTADAAALATAAATGGPIAIRFPTFGDGRGHSLAVLLRERYGFTGEIRAIGYLIPDLAPFLLRSGFDIAEITDANDVETWRGALTRIKHSYQPGFLNPQPLRRNASRKEAEELDELIDSEGLKPDEARAFVANAFRDGAIPTTGTAVTRILPPISRFAAGNSHALRKQTVLDKLAAYFDRFFGLT